MKLCECGCGQPTLPAHWTNARLGTVRGQPNRFLRGHSGGKGSLFKSKDERFWSKVSRGPSCWEWLAYKDSRGYGRFALAAGQMVLAHRFAYENVVGPIPAGKELDHLCRNPGCVRPDHLEPVTHADNLRRASKYYPFPGPKSCEYCGTRFIKAPAGRQSTSRFCDRSCGSKWRESQKRLKVLLELLTA